jgi:hypothetical protein
MTISIHSTRVRLRLRRALCVLALLMGVGSAHASDILITAEFKPSVLNPDKREFVNTTPWSGVCNSTHLQACINNNWWSIDTGIRGAKHAIREDNYGPNGFYVGMPSARTVSVTSDDGAHTFDLKFSIIGTALRLWDQDGDGRTEPASLGAANNCGFGLTNRNANNRSVMRMMLRRDGGEGVVACALHWIDTNNYVMSEFDFTYKLTTPEPLGMPSGVYRGMTMFRVGGTGDGADFDLGNGMVRWTSTIPSNSSCRRVAIAPCSPRRAAGRSGANMGSCRRRWSGSFRSLSAAPASSVYRCSASTRYPMADARSAT